MQSAAFAFRALSAKIFISDQNRATTADGKNVSRRGDLDGKLRA
jgi:hypothetical protein